MERLNRIAVAAAAGALLAGAREARADITLAGDLDVGIPVDQAPARYLSTGAGLDLRLGYRFRVPYQNVTVVPEVALGYTDLSAHIVRARPGVRVGIGRLLVPYLYGHVGWAYTGFNARGTLSTLEPLSSGAQGYSFDAGAGLDVTILRRLTVGAHLGYNVVGVGQTDRSAAFRAKWMSLGLSASFYF